MRWFGSWRIRTQLAVIVAVALSPAALLLVSSYSRSLSAARQRTESEAEDAADRLAQALAEQAASVHGALDTLVAELRSVPPERWRTLVQRQYAARGGELATLIAIAPSGQVVAGPKRTEQMPIYVGDRPYFTEAKAERRLAAGEYAMSRSAGVPTLHFALPVIDAQQQVRLVLAAGLDLRSFGSLATRAGLSPLASYAVTDRAGTSLFRTESADHAIGKPDDPLLFAQTRRGAGHFYTGRGAQAVLHSVATVRLSKDRPPYAFVRYSLPMVHVLAQQRARLIEGAAGLTLATLLATLLTWALWRHGLAQPLDRILTTARALGEGDFAARTGMSGEQHELGLVARALDQTAQALAERDAERRRAEEAMRASEQQLRDSIEYLPLAMGITDDAGQIRTVNSRYTELFGYGRDQVPDIATWIQVAYPDPVYREQVRRQWHADVEQALATGAATRLREYHITCADGTVRDVDIIHRPLGALAVTAFVDVTERNAAARQHLVSERERLEAQSQESLGALAGGVAHDFNNLLTTIIGGIELAQASIGEASPAADDLDAALAGARRAAELTTQIMAYTGQSLRQPSAVQVGQVIEQVVERLRPAPDDLATLQLDLATGLPSVPADAVDIERVVHALISNGLEAVPPDRPVHVLVRTGVGDYDASQLAGSRTPRVPRAGRYVFIEVVDDGVGMSAETQRRLFEPFYSTKFAGRGLGLPALQGIVAAHQGGVLVDSEPGQGARVRVLFPVAPSQPSCLLVVDDDEDVRDLAVSFAARFGWQAVAAADGTAALNQAQQLSGELGLVLLDLTMPDRGGAAVLADLRQQSPHLPVIVCSGHNEQDALRELEPLEPDGFLSKPFTLATFEAALRTAPR